jgi:hydrogenase maturation factor
MNLVYGEIVDLGMEDGMTVGSVRVSGALKKVPLELLTNVNIGDRVLLCDGIAISKVTEPDRTE